MAARHPIKCQETSMAGDGRAGSKATHTMRNYFDVTQQSGGALVRRNIPGEIVMLNLLRFREVADYVASPELAPEQPISGAEAYDRYIVHAMPYLAASGG